jgi:uncharacterized membrane protein
MAKGPIDRDESRGSSIPSVDGKAHEAFGMPKERLAAFSDGVVAILITIMVLELEVPHESTWDAVRPVVPLFLVYALSFVYVAIYWNNHHHLINASVRVNGRILWANLHLLFWLSLVPWATAWMGENDFEALPVAVYGGLLVCAAIAYYVLQRLIVLEHGIQSPLALALGRDLKGKISPVIYAVAIALAFVSRWVALALYVTVALMWLVPDRRLEPLVRGEAAS